jgi:hypothetical protein
MPLAPICILYCKQCITMNEYRICWFSRFGFPGNWRITQQEGEATRAHTSETTLTHSILPI